MFGGLVSQVQVLKAGLPSAGFKAFARQGGAPGLSSVLIVSRSTRDMGFRRACGPASPSCVSGMCFLFAQCEVVTHPAFRFYFRGNCSIGSGRVGVSVQGGELEIDLHLHLRPAPPFVFQLKIFI